LKEKITDMEPNRGTPADIKMDEAQTKIMECYDLLHECYNLEGIGEYHKAFLSMMAEAQGKLIAAHALLRRRMYKKEK
jgi:hypothetical protein